MSGRETMVRMGELAVASQPGDVLVTVGLGSCIGLALLDRRRGLAGLAHIVLPQSSDAGAGVSSPAKFADTVVPALIERLSRLGGELAALEAVLVGGAQMFTLEGIGRGNFDIGAHNDEATRAALRQARIPVRATATGGNKGRTIRVHPADGVVRAKQAGGQETTLFPAQGNSRPDRSRQTVTVA
jgi:chemotaxis protein CheD